MELKTNPKVKTVFNNYPSEARKQMDTLRKLVLDAAKEDSSIGSLEETLKWGEPSYLSKNGSTVRMDWKEKNPKQVAIYFKCTSKLVPSFKSVYGDLFNYENNRAIYFGLDEKIPKKELSNCISAALNYHKLKHLENLGLEFIKD